MQSHRTQSRVKSVSSPRVTLMFLVICMSNAAPTIALSDTVIVAATGFWLTSFDEVDARCFVALCLAIVIGSC